MRIGVRSLSIVGLALALSTQFTLAQQAPLQSSTWTFESNQVSARLGWSVANAGDINGDGFDDGLVAAPSYDVTQPDRGRVWLFLGSPSGLSASAAQVFDGEDEGDMLGLAVASAGDVNGDGYQDVLIGAPNYGNAQSDEGRAYLYLGGASGLATTPAWTAESNQSDAHFGAALSSAGDVNSDGFDDVLVGAPEYDNGQTDEGAVWLYLGSSSGLGSAILVGEGNQNGASYGASVGGGGDVDGDGYDDIAIGAYAFDGSASNSGRAYLHRGTSSGVSGVVWTGEFNQLGAYAGQSVLIAGDINGDGYADLALGGPQWDGGNQTAGAIAVYYGSSSGPSASTFFSPDIASAEFGAPLAATDVNGDGFADLIASAPLWDSAGTNAGRVLVMFGSASGLHTPQYDPLLFADSPQDHSEFGIGLGAGDFNGDGFGDVLVGERGRDNGQTDEGRAYAFHGRALLPFQIATATRVSGQGGANLGQSVASAGDVNGDGFDDVIVGALAFDTGQFNVGAAWLYFGSASGISATPDWTAYGSQAQEFSGYAVAGIGDVNGDGFDEVAVVAPQHSGSAADDGRVRVFHGSAAGPSASEDWSFDGGMTSAFLGITRVSLAHGDFNGDGFSDFAIGAPFFDSPVNDAGHVFVFHGSPSGLAQAPSLQLAGTTFNEYLGFSVAGAGDVDGDGYDDLIVGLPGESVSYNLEGELRLHLGSASGLDANAAWVARGGQANAELGRACAGIGDFNADGFDDLAAGEPRWSAGESTEGRIVIYFGSSSGPNATPDWAFESDQGAAFLGNMLAPAGDVDRDGFADVLVCAPQWDSCAIDAGRTWLVRGSNAPQPSWATNVYSLSAWTPMDACSNGAQAGASAACAGDVNGDGFADLVIGAPYADGSFTDQGAAMVFHGNSELTPNGAPRAMRQLRELAATSIGVVGRGDTPDSFVIHARAVGASGGASSTAGRAKVRLTWEVKPHGTAFDGLGLGHSAWVDTGAVGSSLVFDETVSGLNIATRYKWRARLECDRLGFARTPWFTVHGRSTNEVKLRTGSDCNANLVEDLIDLDQATSPDQNTNLVPDECEGGPFVASYCTGGTTSNGCVATISAVGVAVQGAASGFVLHVDDVEGQKQGLIFYGVNGPHNAPWGGGSTSFLCVKSPTQRMGTLLSGGTNGACDGAFAQDWSAWTSGHPNALGQPFFAGNQVWTQSWFRDPPAPKTTSLSNALEFLVVP